MADLINLQKVRKNTQAIDEFDNMDVENVSDIGTSARPLAVATERREIAEEPADKRGLLDVEEKFKKYSQSVEKRRPLIEARRLEESEKKESKITLDATEEEIDKYRTELKTNLATQSTATMIFGFIQVFSLGLEKLFSKYIGSIDISGFSNQIAENKAVYIDLLMIAAAPEKLEVIDGKTVIVKNTNFISRFAGLNPEYRILIRFTTDLLTYTLKSNAYLLSQMVATRANENKRIEDMKIPSDTD